MWNTVFRAHLNRKAMIEKNKTVKLQQIEGKNTFSQQMSKNANPASISETKDLSSIKRINICVFITKVKNLWYDLSRERRKSVSKVRGKGKLSIECIDEEVMALLQYLLLTS